MAFSEPSQLALRTWRQAGQILVVVGSLRALYGLWLAAPILGGAHRTELGVQEAFFAVIALMAAAPSVVFVVLGVLLARGVRVAWLGAGAGMLLLVAVGWYWGDTVPTRAGAAFPMAMRLVALAAVAAPTALLIHGYAARVGRYAWTTAVLAPAGLFGVRMSTSWTALRDSGDDTGPVGLRSTTSLILQASAHRFRGDDELQELRRRGGLAAQ